MTFKLLVCGGRDYADADTMCETLDAINAERLVTHLIHGAARGADTMAGAWARARGVQEVACPANWTRYAKSAGYKRNSAMLQLRPDLVVAFPGGPGTANMVALATRANIPVRNFSDSPVSNS